MLNVIAGGIKLFDTILFDLDGTLTDPFEGISNSIIYALKKFGIAAPEKTLLKKFIGPPLTESFSKSASYGILFKVLRIKLFGRFTGGGVLSGIFCRNGNF